MIKDDHVEIVSVKDMGDHLFESYQRFLSGEGDTFSHRDRHAGTESTFQFHRAMCGGVFCHKKKRVDGDPKTYERMFKVVPLEARAY
jgi:hypothetical protein